MLHCHGTCSEDLTSGATTHQTYNTHRPVHNYKHSALQSGLVHVACVMRGVIENSLNVASTQ